MADLVQIRFTRSTGLPSGTYNADEVAGFDPGAARALVAKDRAVYVDAAQAEVAVAAEAGVPAKKGAARAKRGGKK